MRRESQEKFPLVYINLWFIREMFEPCILPKYDNPLKTPTDKVLNILSMGFYGVVRTGHIIEKYNKDMDEYHECLRLNMRCLNENKINTYIRNDLSGKTGGKPVGQKTIQ